VERTDFAAAARDCSYAGLITRTIAFAIDAALINLAALAVAGVVGLVLSIFPVSQAMADVVKVAGAVLWGVWLVAYFVTFWSTSGATPGSYVMRVRVVRCDGGRLRPRHALARFAGLLLGLPLFAGYVPILLTDRRRGLHDVLGGTVVVEQAVEPSDPGLRGHPPVGDRLE
jgi:uncharacterized RDD family membrane protein YckC